MLTPEPSFINIHSHFKPRSEQEITVRNAYLALTGEQALQLPYRLSAGLHPWHLRTMSLNECGDKLMELSRAPNVSAIGEIGIDRAIDVPVAEQVAYFDVQLNIARALKKPVIIHAVRSYSDLLPFLKKTKVPFIFHQFNGNEQQARELLKHHCKLSFGRNLQQEKTQNVLRAIPLTDVLLETDSVPGVNIEDIYRLAASVRQVELDELKSVVFHTFAGLVEQTI